MGNQMSPYIRAQNALVSRIAFLLALCHHRGVYFIVDTRGRPAIQPHFPVTYARSMRQGRLTSGSAERLATSLDRAITAGWCGRISRLLARSSRNHL